MWLKGGQMLTDRGDQKGMLFNNRLKRVETCGEDKIDSLDTLELIEHNSHLLVHPIILKFQRFILDMGDKGKGDMQ